MVHEHTDAKMTIYTSMCRKSEELINQDGQYKSGMRTKEDGDKSLLSHPSTQANKGMGHVIFALDTPVCIKISKLYGNLKGQMKLDVCV